MELNNRKATEGLIEALGHYLPGDKQERRERTSRLLNQILDEKALAYLRRKFQLQAYKTLCPLIEDMNNIGEVWKKEALSNGLKKNKGSKDGKEVKS